MPLQVRFQGGRRAGQMQTFGDEVVEIVIGRDSERCQICFDADERRVGREHCAIMRELGRYSVKPSRENIVLLDGKPVEISAHLPSDRDTELQLGSGGPLLIVSPKLNEGTAANPLLSTEGPKKQGAGIGTSLKDAEQKAAAGRRRATFALTAAVLLGVGGYLTYVRLYERDENLAHEIVNVSNVTASQQRDLNMAVSRLSERTDVIANREKLLPEAAKKVLASVYVVLQKSGDDGFYPCGTAWVVDRERGLLATNGHVAELFKEPTPGEPDDDVLYVRSPGEKPNDFRVASVKIHPGYESFSRLWDRYDPSRPIGTHRRQGIRSAGPACDVAVLQVSTDDAPKLAPDLKLAADDALHSLQTGESIGLVGYPMEGVVLGGVNIASPTPQTRFGQVTALTDYFGSTSDATTRHLVHHSIPTSGGASGSPIYNPRGEVVAIHNAGNSITIRLEDQYVPRLGSPASIQYAQRIDLLRELLTEAAAQRQEDRDKVWNTEIAKSYQPGRRLEADYFVDEGKAELRDALQADGEYDVKEEKPVVLELPPEKDAEMDEYQRRSQTLELPAAGTYFLTAFSQDGNDLTFHITSLDEDGNRAFHHGSSLGDVDWIQSATLPLASPQKVQVTVSGVTGDEMIRVTATPFVTQRKSEEQLHELAREKWRSDFFDLFADTRFEKALELKGKLGPKIRIGDQDACAAVVDLAALTPGDYVATLVAAENEAVCLVITEADESSEGDASRVSPWVWKSFHVSGDKEVKAAVVGLDPGVAYSLAIHRIKQPSTP